eukprot:CAMPEP_0197073664 /NCGR_PEP_ID=MMETSP1384-20130603/210720_1 /TAXON_ID=29189 /ORGANISM="Ammonia sp." /LENGTH=192 /DNA_ID=CAMNT_0042512503 /DNA_START=592 /DNA_END=1167 /DNA_ORIENTATION=+
MATPVPCSIPSSDLDDDSDSDILEIIDIDSIKPYVPELEPSKPDIDLVYNFSDKSSITLISAGSARRSDINVIDEEVADSYTDTEDDIEDSDDSPHPAIAALTARESQDLLNAPVWSPDDIELSSDEEDEEEEKSLQAFVYAQAAHNVVYSKIAMDEQDYQFIIHPNKKPVKYGYMDAQRAAQSKVARDDTV